MYHLLGNRIWYREINDPNYEHLCEPIEIERFFLLAGVEIESDIEISRSILSASVKDLEGILKRLPELHRRQKDGKIYLPGFGGPVEYEIDVHDEATGLLICKRNNHSFFPFEITQYGQVLMGAGTSSDDWGAGAALLGSVPESQYEHVRKLDLANAQKL